MARYFLNSLTLHEVGLRLLPDENVVVAVELEGGLTEELEQSEATLLLTNRRLVRYYAAGHKASVISTVLDDIDSVEVVRSRRNKQWMWVGMVFVGGGILLGIVSLMLAWPTLSPLLMALSLVLIGVVFGIAYRSGMAGEVIVRAGVKDIRCKMGPKALNDMATFLEKYYELKLGYNTEPNDADSIASPQAAAPSGAAETPAG
jgi:hypothetical protein